MVVLLLSSVLHIAAPELVSYRSDVMCLQEVQADHFENFLEPELAKFNYAGLYKV